MALGIFKSSFVGVPTLSWVDWIDPPVSFHPRIRQLESKDELLERISIFLDLIHSMSWKKTNTTKCPEHIAQMSTSN